jgi:hypothetical protein
VEKKGEYLRLRFLILIIQNATDMRQHGNLANDSKKDIIGMSYISVRTFCLPSRFTPMPRKGCL